MVDDGTTVVLQVHEWRHKGIGGELPGVAC